MDESAWTARALGIVALSLCACTNPTAPSVPAAGVTSFGMGSGVSNGDLRFTHAGGLDNYSSFSVMFPADRSSVVLLCNSDYYDPNGLFNFVMGIRSIMLGR